MSASSSFAPAVGIARAAVFVAAQHRRLPGSGRAAETTAKYADGVRAVAEGRFAQARTPLREALKMLASEGLVTLTPNRGASVSLLTVAELEDAVRYAAGSVRRATRSFSSSIRTRSRDNRPSPARAAFVRPPMLPRSRPQGGRMRAIRWSLFLNSALGDFWAVVTPR